MTLPALKMVPYFILARFLCRGSTAFFSVMMLTSLLFLALMFIKIKILKMQNNKPLVPPRVIKSSGSLAKLSHANTSTHGTAEKDIQGPPTQGQQIRSWISVNEIKKMIGKDEDKVSELHGQQHQRGKYDSSTRKNAGFSSEKLKKGLQSSDSVLTQKHKNQNAFGDPSNFFDDAPKNAPNLSEQQQQKNSMQEQAYMAGIKRLVIQKSLQSEEGQFHQQRPQVMQPEILESSCVAEVHPTDFAKLIGPDRAMMEDQHQKSAYFQPQAQETKSSGSQPATSSLHAASSTKELMRMTLEQSQQVLFHGLAFGTTDSLSLDNYKSHTTTPSNQAAKKQAMCSCVGSRNSCKHSISGVATMDAAALQNAARISFSDDPSAQQQFLLSSTFDANSNGELAIGCSRDNIVYDPYDDNRQLKTTDEATKLHKKPQLRIHTKIDENFQIQSSMDADDEEIIQTGPDNNKQIMSMVSPLTGTDTVVEHVEMTEITGKDQTKLENFRYASSQLANQPNNQNNCAQVVQEHHQLQMQHVQKKIIPHARGEYNQEMIQGESDEGDAFDRLIKKTYDRDCEKFFQRIDKLKRLNSCEGSSQRSKSSMSNKNSSQLYQGQKRRPLSSLSGGQPSIFQPSKVLALPTAKIYHNRLNSQTNFGHSFSQIQIMPVSSQNVRNCNSKMFKPLIPHAVGTSSELQKRAQFNSGVATSKADTEAALQISSDLNQPYTQISTVEERQIQFCNEKAIRMIDDAVITDEMTDGDGINDKLTCKRSQALQPSRTVQYSQQETERRRDQQMRLIFKLQHDIDILKGLVREEKLKNQRLATEMDKLRLEREIESPTYKMQELKYKMERERVGLEESKAKLEKQVYRLKEELQESKEFYEERITQLSETINRLQVDNDKWQRLVRQGSKGSKSSALFSLNKIDTITESLNASSVGLNGTSIEDIKELTLNMKVPASFNKRTKAETEATSQYLGKKKTVHESIDDYLASQQKEQLDNTIEEIAEEDIESNYVTNGSYAQGIPSQNRGILDQQQLLTQESQNPSQSMQGAINQSTITASKSLKQNTHQHLRLTAGPNNDTLISQSMQLSEDEDEEVVVGAQETSISYLTKDNFQQNSFLKFHSNLTRKTTNQSNLATTSEKQSMPLPPPRSQLDQFNAASGRIAQQTKQSGSQILTLRKGFPRVLQSERCKELGNSLDIDAQDSQILEESGVEPHKIKVASFNMQQQETASPSLFSQIHKKQQSAPQLPHSNTGSVQLNMTAEGSIDPQLGQQEDIMSNFEDKLSGLMRQIDDYLEVLREQSLLTSERSSGIHQLMSTGQAKDRGTASFSAHAYQRSAGSLKQMNTTFGQPNNSSSMCLNSSSATSLSQRMAVLRNDGHYIQPYGNQIDQTVDQCSDSRRDSLSYRLHRPSMNFINNSAGAESTPFMVVTQNSRQTHPPQILNNSSLRSPANLSQTSIGGSGLHNKVELISDSLAKMQCKLNQLRMMGSQVFDRNIIHSAPPKQ